MNIYMEKEMPFRTYETTIQTLDLNCQ